MYRILLVDDEILVRDAIRENIDWAGMDCELVGDCENGQQAAEFVKHNPVDIVLTDICMPYMDGMELSHFLHDNYPDVVIVIFSGFGEFEYAKKAIQYNVSEYLLKPITAMELTAVIGRMKEKVDQKQEEKRKLEKLTRNSQDYRKNAQMIRSRAIEALVRCTRDTRESLEELEGMGITLDAFRYRVAVFDIDLYSGLFTLDVEKRQESALMAFVLFNVSSEIVEKEKAGLVYQEGSNRVCVLFTGAGGRKSADRTIQICREIQQKVKEVIGMEVSVGVGSWVHVPEELVFSWQEAADALRLRYLLGGHLLIDAEQDLQDGELSLAPLLEQLQTVMKAGKKESMELCLSRMEGAIKETMADKSRACTYLQEIIRAAGEVGDSVASDPEGRTEKREKVMHQVTEQPTFWRAISLVKDYVEEVFAEISERNSSSGQRQAALALDFIQNNYMDSELSLNVVCSYLNISASYFSTIFKEETGETFTEVLSRIRMEKAKELLENTMMKNYEIAEKVGFSDPHYFGISFKKATGKTPTEYAREKRR